MQKEPIDRIEDILTLEENVLASLIMAWQMNRKGLTASLRILAPDDFQRDLNRLIFQAIASLDDRDQEITPTTITEWFTTNVKRDWLNDGKELLRRYSNHSYLGEIIASTPEGAPDNVLKLAKQLKKSSLLFTAFYLLLKGIDISGYLRMIQSLDQKGGVSPIST